jgi:hypothetical protein
MQRLHLTPQQQEVFQELLSNFGHQLLAISFEEPEKDQQMIRYHANTKGRVDMLTFILNDNWADPEATEQPANNQTFGE